MSLRGEGDGTRAPLKSRESLSAFCPARGRVGRHARCRWDFASYRTGPNGGAGGREWLREDDRRPHHDWPTSTNIGRGVSRWGADRSSAQGPSDSPNADGVSRPAGSLDPKLPVGRSVAEPLQAHRWGDRKAIADRVKELLTQVGLDSDAAKRFPHEFSGGQRQRIGIARAIALEPDLVFADEPTSALDVSIRVQILNLLADIQQRLGTSFLLVSHDLAVVRHYSQRVAVMLAGKIVEEGSTEQVLSNPAHPYTRKLLDAVPKFGASPKPMLP